MYLAMNLVFAVAMSSALGAIYFASDNATSGIQNRLGAFFFMLAYMAIMSLSSLPAFADQSVLFLHERSLGTYSSAAAFVATVVVDFVPLRVIPPLAFVSATYPLVGLRDGIALRCSALLVLTLAHAACSASGMVVGVWVPNLGECLVLTVSPQSSVECLILTVSPQSSVVSVIVLLFPSTSSSCSPCCVRLFTVTPSFRKTLINFCPAAQT